MADDPTKRGTPDNDLISLTQSHQAAYWTKMLGVPETRLRGRDQGSRQIGKGSEDTIQEMISNRPARVPPHVGSHHPQGNTLRKITFTLALLLAAAPALADSIYIGNKLIVDGDGAGKVLEVAGAPNRIIQLETLYGGSAGERWEYYLDGKTILIDFHGGKVTSITETR